MDTKLIVRILNEQEEMLGWAEAVGHARGDGKIWVDAPTQVFIEESGVVFYLSVHWCDVNVEIRSRVDPASVIKNNMLELPGDWPAITCGPAAGGLPPVTVRAPIVIGIPVGAMGLKVH